MPEIIARCGFRCDLCPAYSGNIGPSTDTRSISDGWFKYFGFRIPPEEIECVGCMNEGRHADADCPVRPCAIEKKLENCAHYGDFVCEKLGSRMEFVETVLPKFDVIPEGDFEHFIRPYLNRETMMRIRKENPDVLSPARGSNSGEPNDPA